MVRIVHLDLCRLALYLAAESPLLPETGHEEDMKTLLYYREPKTCFSYTYPTAHEHYFQWALDLATSTLVLRCSCDKVMTLKEIADWINAKG